MLGKELSRQCLSRAWLGTTVGTGARAARSAKSPPSPALPFATRKGGCGSGSAEPCSARGFPGNATCRACLGTTVGAGARAARSAKSQPLPSPPLRYAKESAQERQPRTIPRDQTPFPYQTPCRARHYSWSRCACGEISEKPPLPQPSPSLREREGAGAVVPSHARQGDYMVMPRAEHGSALQLEQVRLDRVQRKPTPPQPSPSLRERERAGAVVPSHARQGDFLVIPHAEHGSALPRNRQVTKKKPRDAGLFISAPWRGSVPALPAR